MSHSHNVRQHQRWRRLCLGHAKVASLLLWLPWYVICTVAVADEVWEVGWDSCPCSLSGGSVFRSTAVGPSALARLVLQIVFRTT